MSIARKSLLLAALLPALALSSCLIGGHSKPQVTGTKVGAETIAQVQPGKSKTYVLALLGEPTVRLDVGNGSELWKWSYSEHRTSSGSVLFVIGSTSEKETTSTCYVEFAHEIVTRAWRD